MKLVINWYDLYNFIFIRFDLMKNMISSISQGVGKEKSKIWGVKIFWRPIGEKTSLVPNN
jgi:hypothetical protein